MGDKVSSRVTPLVAPLVCDLCRWLETSVTLSPSMNRGRVTKRQLDRDILGKRGLGRPSIPNDLAASTNPPLFSWLFESIYSASPFTAPSYCPFSLSFSLCILPLLFLSFSFSLSFSQIHIHLLSRFLFPLLSTVLPRCLTLFSLRESCNDPCTRFARYRERIKYLLALVRCFNFTPLMHIFAMYYFYHRCIWVYFVYLCISARSFIDYSIHLLM